jgi:hypothetical protein
MKNENNKEPLEKNIFGFIFLVPILPLQLFPDSIMSNMDECVTFFFLGSKELEDTEKCL